MKGKVLFCLTFLLFSLTNLAFAQETLSLQNSDREPMSLSEIDELIDKTEYESALHELTFYLDVYPNQFDNAQLRIARIMNARVRYSELATKLIDLIRNDPTNNKKIYEIILELETFEKNPSDENLRFIADLKKSAEFNYFRSSFLEIQEEVAESVKEGDLVDAIQKSQDGFWVYKDAFYEQWGDKPDVIQAVDRTVANLNNHLNSFKVEKFSDEIDLAIKEFITAVNNDQYTLALDKFKNVQYQLDEYLNAINLVLNDKKEIESIMEKLKPIDSTITEASYLAFLVHYLTGVESIESSGIITAINSKWNNYISDMNDSVFAMLTNKYDLYNDSLNKFYVSNIKNYVNLEQNVYKQGDKPYETGTINTENPLKDYVMLTDYVAKLTDSVAGINDTLKLIKTNENIQAGLIEKKNNAETAEKKYSYVVQLVEKTADLDVIAGNRADLENDFAKWSLDYSESSYENWDELTEKYFTIIDNVYSTRDEIVDNSWNEITDFYVSEGGKIYDVVNSYKESANAYNKGVFAKVPEDVLKDINRDITKAVDFKNSLNEDDSLNLGVYYHYPDISIKLLDYANKQIDIEVANINRYRENLKSNYEYSEKWKDDKIVSDKYYKTDEFLNQRIDKLLSLRDESKPYYEEARNMIIAAEVAKNEADLRFEEAEAALDKENFAKARKNLQSALVKYDESLNNQNNETLRAQWDKKLQDLGERITRSENQLVVKDVRELKNKAKDAYFNGRFDDAENYLTQASAKWALTNVTEDPEIVNLMNFVNTAISMKTGREILPSAPQYPEMSQLINIAHQKFEEGRSLLKTGKKSAAEDKFDEALESIQKVQYVYPLNQEASLLTLQINKLSDPEKFEEEFANKIESAVQACKNKKTQQEGYANLLDYYKLDPGYPGLKEIIYNVEIDIGIRQKPVDNSGKLKGQQYARDAEKIFRNAGNNLSELNRALDKVNQALALIPDDTDAMNLKDRITTKMGGNASTVLSTEDERLYQLAIQRLQNNNVVGANAIVDELLKKPQNKYSKKIKDLKNKIEARS